MKAIVEIPDIGFRREIDVAVPVELVIQCEIERAEEWRKSVDRLLLNTFFRKRRADRRRDATTWSHK